MNTLYLAYQVSPWLFYIFWGILGACVGSFLNVCIHRIPQGISIITPRSRCQCGTPIVWYDNVPILSWFILLGKARCCRAFISPRYPLVEALTAALFVLCWHLFPAEQAVVYSIFISFLVGASFIDLQHMIIPDSFTMGGFLFGLIASFTIPEIHTPKVFFGLPYLAHLYSLGFAIFSASIASGVLFWFGFLTEKIFNRESIGFADITFIGFIATVVGYQGALFAIFGGAFLATLILIPVMLTQKILKKPLHGASAWQAHLQEDETLRAQEAQGRGLGLHVPYGPWLALAALVYLLWLEPWVSIYFSNIEILIKK